MSRLVRAEELFTGRHFNQEIVVLCVCWYLSFKLGFRDLVTMMGEHGLPMAHTPFFAGSSMTLQDLRNEGSVMLARPQDSGGWMKRT